MSVSSEKGNAVLCEFNDVTDVYYTSDFLVFNLLPSLEGSVGMAKITDDGYTVMMFTEYDLYAITVVPTNNGNFTFKNWTSLIDYFTIADDTITSLYKRDLTFDSYSDIHAITYDNFVACTTISRLQHAILDSGGYSATLNSLVTINVNSGIMSIESLTDSTYEFDTVTEYLNANKNGSLNTYSNVTYTRGNKTISIVDIKIDTTYADEPFLTCIINTIYNEGKSDEFVIDQQRVKTIPNHENTSRWSWRLSDNGYLITFTVFKDDYKLEVKLDMSNDKCIISPWYEKSKLKCTCNKTGNGFNYALITQNGITKGVAINFARDVYNKQLLPISMKDDVTLCDIDKNDVFIRGSYLYTIVDNKKYKSIYETDLSRNLKYDIDMESRYFKFSTEGYLLTDKYFYNTLDYRFLNDNKIEYLFNIKPVFLSIPLEMSIAYDSEYLYSVLSEESKLLELDEVIQGENKYISPSHIVELDNWYMAKNNVLYISSYVNGNDYKWYFPKINTEHIDYDITALHPISTNEMGVFTENNIYYVRPSESVYLYYKSKLSTGCKQGSTVITSYDGKYVLFVSPRGLLALTYQQLVESTEQVLTFLSDTIYDTFKEYNTEPIVLHQYDYWILCYKRNSSDLLVFDLRSNSWWPITVPYNIDKIYTSNDKLYVIANNKIFTLSKSSDDYFDYNGVDEERILWRLLSQKLHLNSIDYCKHIDNLTLCSVQDSNEPINLDLSVTTYRKRSTSSEAKNFEFKVDAVRTYIKKLNYFKVNEFQYKLESSNIVNNIPLSLASIAIKYKITGQVR